MSNYLLGGIEFKTKAAIGEHARAILHATPTGSTLGMGDFMFMCDLLDMHEDAVQKIGCGVYSISVEQDLLNYNSRGFWLHRNDGTETDFSYLKCLSRPSNRSKVLAAMREIVMPFCMAYRSRYFSTYANSSGYAPCEVSGVLLSVIDAHVDHAWPWEFKSIVAAFVKDRHLNIETTPIKPTTDGSVRNELLDEQMAEDFYQYHAGKAILRVVAKQLNTGAIKDNPELYGKAEPQPWF